MTTESIGPFLQHARETQGLSLDQVASTTRIQLKYLQAIEEEQFAALPEQVFTKGFVRTYARSLGMDEQDVLRRFSQARNEYFGRDQQEDERVQLNMKEEKRGKPNRTVILILIVVIVLGLGLYLSRQQQPTPPLNTRNHREPVRLLPVTSGRRNKNATSATSDRTTQRANSGFRANHRFCGTRTASGRFTQGRRFTKTRKTKNALRFPNSRPLAHGIGGHTTHVGGGQIRRKRT